MVIIAFSNAFTMVLLLYTIGIVFFKGLPILLFSVQQIFAPRTGIQIHIRDGHFIGAKIVTIQ